jgi:hypothetical protein
MGQCAMGFQWGWDKRLPRGAIGRGGLVALGFFAIGFGWILIPLILGYILIAAGYIYDLVLWLARLVGMA